MLVDLGKQPGPSSQSKEARESRQRKQHAKQPNKKAAAATAAEKRCHWTLRNVYDARRLQPNVHRKRRRNATNG
jgi:hypothetical protein